MVAALRWPCDSGAGSLSKKSSMELPQTTEPSTDHRWIFYSNGVRLLTEIPNAEDLDEPLREPEDGTTPLDV
jgi:hypothetical protein